MFHNLLLLSFSLFTFFRHFLFNLCCNFFSIRFRNKISLIEHHAHIALIVLDVKIRFPTLYVATGARRVRPNGFH